MFTVLLGILAALLGGAGVLAKHPAEDRPLDQFDMPTTMSVAAVGVPAITMEPYSELKFKNIVHQAYDYSCGSAALVTLLKYYVGVDVTEQQSMEGMMAFGEKDKIIERRGFSLLDMKRYLASIHVESAGFHAEVGDLLTLDQPGIVPIDFGGFKHFVVLRGVRDGQVFIADPAAGNTVYNLADFLKMWDRNTLFIAYPQKDHPPSDKLALADSELGVVDMDRIRDRGIQRPIDTQTQMERLLNGFGGISIRRQ